MARVQLTVGAVEDLTRLIETHNLPADTRRRVPRSLQPLQRFPRLGAEIGERRPGCRYLVGPWPWLVVVYRYVEQDDRVDVLSIEDWRSARASTGDRGLSSR